MEEQTFAQRLLEHRSSLGLSQEQVGSILKVTSQTISNWEAGTIPRKARIAQVEAWITSGQAPDPEPIKIGPTGYAASTPESKEVGELRKIAADLRKKQLADVRKQQAQERLVAKKEELRTFTTDLPEPLRQFAGSWERTHKDVNLTAEYISPEVFARLVFPTSSLSALEPTVLGLLASKALDTEEDDARKFYAVIVIGAEPETQARNLKLKTVASLLGVDINFVPDATGAAEVVARLEDIATFL